MLEKLREILNFWFDAVLFIVGFFGGILLLASTFAMFTISIPWALFMLFVCLPAWLAFITWLWQKDDTF